MKVVKYLMELIGQGVKVHYVTGNHDEMLRKFVGFELGSFAIKNKLILNILGLKINDSKEQSSPIGLTVN